MTSQSLVLELEIYVNYFVNLGLVSKMDRNANVGKVSVISAWFLIMPFKENFKHMYCF